MEELKQEQFQMSESLRLKKIINETINGFLLKESNTHQEYYRAVTEFKGNNVIFQPKGFYEAFDDEGNLEFHTDDVYLKSNIPEISASKTVGGALLGVWSMLNHHGELKDGTKLYVYSIKEKPHKDLSHLKMDDFEWLKEVRYKEPVEAEYVGYFIFDGWFNDLAENFYERLTGDPWEEYGEEQIKKYNDFEKYILTINKKNLKK